MLVFPPLSLLQARREYLCLANYNRGCPITLHLLVLSSEHASHRTINHLTDITIPWLNLVTRDDRGTVFYRLIFAAVLFASSWHWLSFWWGYNSWYQLNIKPDPCIFRESLILFHSEIYIDSTDFCVRRILGYQLPFMFLQVFCRGTYFGVTVAVLKAVFMDSLWVSGTYECASFIEIIRVITAIQPFCLALICSEYFTCCQWSHYFSFISFINWWQ